MPLLFNFGVIAFWEVSFSAWNNLTTEGKAAEPRHVRTKRAKLLRWRQGWRENGPEDSFVPDRTDFATTGPEQTSCGGTRDHFSFVQYLTIALANSLTIVPPIGLNHTCSFIVRPSILRRDLKHYITLCYTYCLLAAYVQQCPKFSFFFIRSK